MLADLEALLNAVPADAPHEAYRRAIQDDNVLGKKTASTRLWAYKKLRELYALDPQLAVFAELRARWSVSPDGRPLLALLAALARDALLRSSVDAITGARFGAQVTRDDFRRVVVSARGDRFSESTMQAVLSHLLSSWTESGHLSGKKEKVRSRAIDTPAVTAFALALGYLAGARGELLFSTLWTSVLDASPTVLHEHAREASRLGWLTYRGIGNIIDVSFPNLRPQSEFAL
jgi:hypothetical protein